MSFGIIVLSPLADNCSNASLAVSIRSIAVFRYHRIRAPRKSLPPLEARRVGGRSSIPGVPCCPGASPAPPSSSTRSPSGSMLRSGPKSGQALPRLYRCKPSALPKRSRERRQSRPSRKAICSSMVTGNRDRRECGSPHANGERKGPMKIPILSTRRPRAI
jgi:hypothetical protein